MRALFYRKKQFPIIAMGIVVCVALWGVWGSNSLLYGWERVMLFADPSVGRAYAYGLEHFDHAKPRSHDIDRAEYFFRRAAALDEQYPLVHHQLARIEFLRGKFPKALEEANKEIAIQGDKNPSAFYVRALIAGYQGNYDAAIADFSHFLTLRPESWAAANDLAWVLMRASRYADAVPVLEKGLSFFPENPWLLNSYAIALYEVGRREEAAPVAHRARDAVMKLTPQDWSRANPGNDPRIAGEGLETFRNATIRNLEIIEQSASSDALQ